ncbi:DUF4391 domain-containing protein [Bifidobacterium eulemuris]|uniref:DUF4391 domain-containing protein n=2 Tax=Bifidobacterium eulemuris TaxID=1765219 RepID=A0A7L9SMS6_9BIFI|nr:DUF4391 domain-containing protein [Bifidobacterium eulemuris]QOL31176.1 DUF4391 domain-containing protein [Bifidobacterium eulemuris]
MMTAAACGTVSALTLGLPASTAIPAAKGTLPKQMFMAKAPVSAKLKQRYANEVESITMLSLMRAANTGLADGKRFREILVIGLRVSGTDVPVEVVDHIASQRASGIVFAVVREVEREGARHEECALAVRRNVPVRPGHTPVTKVYAGDWKPAGEAQLELAGSTLDEAWDVLCAQAILDSADGSDLDARIARREQLTTLKAQADKLERDHSRAKNPAQRNEIYAKLHKIRKQLETLES